MSEASASRLDAARGSARRFFEPLLLVAILAGLSAVCGWLVAGRAGILAAVAVTLFLVAALRFAPTGWVLSIFGTEPVRREEAPELVAALDELCARAGIGEVPTIYAARNPLLLAATIAGADRSAIVVSRKVLRTLTPRELRAVLAHEIAHLAHRDLPLMQLGRALAVVTGSLSRFALMLILLQVALGLFDRVIAGWWELATLVTAPIAANLVVLALSRNREFDADAAAARLTGDPEALATALDKLERMEARFLRRALPGLAPLPRWLRTHPAPQERIARLERRH
jgi:heat shock protein HtpX